MDELNPPIEVFDASLLEGLEKGSSSNLSISRQKHIALLIDELERRKKFGGLRNWFVPGTPYGIERLPKHYAFFSGGAEYRERGAFAGNRSGKTISGAYETACHLTGDYPEWWVGKRFDKPVRVWACAETWPKCRDTVQKELLGSAAALGTGMIPDDCIEHVWAKAGIPNGIEMAKIKHVSGGFSLVVFKAYEQSVKTYVGEAIDVVWLDEEPPQLIYNESLIRLMTTGGILYVTCTPISGITPFVVDFCKGADHLAGAKEILPPSTDQSEVGKKGVVAVYQWGWDDAPWLDNKAKEDMYLRTPENLKEARRTGRPAMGSGNVFPYDIENLLVDPFEIPASWKRVYGMDVGYNNTAAVFGAIDPNTKMLYLYDEYLGNKCSPGTNAEIIRRKQENWIPGVMDPGSLQSLPDGENLFRMYRDLGLNITLAKNARESGIEAIRELIRQDKFRAFRTLRKWREEYVKYRYDEKRPDKVVDGEDDIMDAWRYLVMALPMARPRLETDTSPFGDDDGSGRRYW